MRIGDVLKAKPSHEVVTITPEAGVRDLVARLAEHNVGALIVSSDGVTLEGIVSERDVVRHLHSDGTVVNNTVAAIMTTEVETCDQDTNVDDLMKIMTAAPDPARAGRRGRPGGRGDQHRRRGQAPHRPARVRARPAQQLRQPVLAAPPLRRACGHWLS